MKEPAYEYHEATGGARNEGGPEESARSEGVLPEYGAELHSSRDGCRSAVLTDEQYAFLQKIVPAALDCERKTGIPAAITTAQAIRETGWGKDSLSSEANNFFGITHTPFCESHGAYGSVTKLTHEFRDGQRVEVRREFSAFRSLQDCFDCRVALFRQAKRYGAAMATAASKLDPHAKAAQFAVDISRAGYASDPRYADGLMQLVDELGLSDPVKLAAYAMNPEEMAARAEGPEELTH